MQKEQWLKLLGTIKEGDVLCISDDTDSFYTSKLLQYVATKKKGIYLPISAYLQFGQGKQPTKMYYTTDKPIPDSRIIYCDAAMQRGVIEDIQPRCIDNHVVKIHCDDAINQNSINFNHSISTSNYTDKSLASSFLSLLCCVGHDTLINEGETALTLEQQLTILCCDSTFLTMFASFPAFNDVWRRVWSIDEYYSDAMTQDREKFVSFARMYKLEKKKQDDKPIVDKKGRLQLELLDDWATQFFDKIPNFVEEIESLRFKSYIEMERITDTTSNFDNMIDFKNKYPNVVNFAVLYQNKKNNIVGCMINDDYKVHQIDDNKNKKENENG